MYTYLEEITDPKALRSERVTVLDLSHSCRRCASIAPPAGCWNHRKFFSKVPGSRKGRLGTTWFNPAVSPALAVGWPGWPPADLSNSCFPTGLWFNLPGPLAFNQQNVHMQLSSLLPGKPNVKKQAQVTGWWYIVYINEIYIIYSASDYWGTLSFLFPSKTQTLLYTTAAFFSNPNSQDDFGRKCFLSPLHQLIKIL